MMDDSARRFVNQCDLLGLNNMFFEVYKSHKAIIITLHSQDFVIPPVGLNWLIVYVRCCYTGGRIIIHAY